MTKISDSTPSLIIGIGASAGGLDALKQFFRTVPSDAKLAFVVVQHLDPNHKSMMAQILARESAISISEAQDKQSIDANAAYIIPPNAYIEVVDNTIHISEPSHQRGSRLAIDHLFRSMAEVYGSRAVGILFSGTGSDGTAGLRVLKAAGGLTIAQDPRTAEYAGMPRSAIEAGVIDSVLSIDKMTDLLQQYARHPYHQLEELDDKASTHETRHKISALLKAQENFDLDQYKEATVQRRIYRRMGLTGKNDYPDYIALLRDSADERQNLMRDLLINVTDFFRDKAAFEILEHEAIEEIIRNADHGDEIRVWVAGCASGEEAYSIAMLLMEKIATAKKDLEIKIFATDVDAEAIATARRGVYSLSVASELPPSYIKKYLQLKDKDFFVVSPLIRDRISFAVQNVYTDPPFSKMHLISCRNLLIYLKREVQQKVLKSFSFSLNKSGFLFLGSSESTGEQKDLFRPISKKWRIYQRREHGKDKTFSTTQPSFFQRQFTNGKKGKESDRAENGNHTKLALLSGLAPSVLIDGDNKVLYFHGDLAPFIKLPEGEAALDFINMLAPALRTRLRSGIYKARKTQTRTLVHAPREHVESSASKTSFQMIITPVQQAQFSEDHLVVSFEESPELDEVQSAKRLGIESDDQEKMIEAMERELLDTREELQNTVEELETSTEELKAAHEEALSTNEELQSSNEELEASTEELRSLNEELTTVNDQLKEKVDLLSAAHDDIKNFFASTNLATVFLSNDLKIKRITPAAERLLRIGSRDIDRPIEEIERSLLNEYTVDEAKKVLQSLEGSDEEIQSEDGHWFTRKILPYQTEDRRIEGVVLAFNDITKLKNSVQDLQASGSQHAVIAKLGLEALRGDDLDSLMDQMVREIAYTLDADFCKILEYTPKENSLRVKAGVGWSHGIVGTATVASDTNSQAGFTLRSSGPVIVDDLRKEQRFSGPALLSSHKVISGISCVIPNGGEPYGVLGVHTKAQRKFTRDDANFLVSAANILSVALHRKHTEQQLRENEERLRVAKDSNRMGSFEYNILSGENFWDDIVKDMWGIRREERVMMDDFYAGVHPDDREATTYEIERACDPDSSGHYRAVYRVINRETKKVSWAEASGQVIFENRKPLKMIGMVLDVSEQKKMEDSLNAAIIELTSVNKRKNEFLAALGHELRNPLAAVSSGVQVMQHDASKADWALGMMSNNVRIMSALLDDLLDLSRISRGQIKLKKQALNLNKLLGEIKQSFSTKIDDKGQNFRLILPAEDIITVADPLRIEQVIGNVLSNAHKFTPKDGNISIKLSRVKNQVVLVVSDSGVGLDIEDKNYIFEPFQQINNDSSLPNSGLGIGLSLVKQIVLLHRGSVEVESKGRDMGTKFTISLPYVSAASESSESKTADALPTTFQHLRILLVDDNQDAANGLAYILKLRQCEISKCYDAKSAIIECDEFKPNVLLLDIGLPEMSGYELLARIRAKHIHKTFNIALTGFGHSEAKLNSKEAGFHRHFTKPVDVDGLLTILAQVDTAIGEKMDPRLIK